MQVIFPACSPNLGDQIATYVFLKLDSHRATQASRNLPCYGGGLPSLVNDVEAIHDSCICS
jgi:hypothetical protein